MERKIRISRRGFLKLAGLTTAALAAGCLPNPTKKETNEETNEETITGLVEKTNPNGIKTGDLVVPADAYSVNGFYGSYPRTPEEYMDRRKKAVRISIGTECLVTGVSTDIVEFNDMEFKVLEIRCPRETINPAKFNSLDVLYAPATLFLKMDFAPEQ